MSFDLTTLAQNGAGIIVAAMATEFWTQVRSQVARLLGRGDERQEDETLSRLDEVQAALEGASSEEARDAQVELRTILKEHLRNDPDLAAQFAALVDEVAARVTTEPQTTTVTQRARADQGSTVIQGGRDVSIYERPKR